MLNDTFGVMTNDFGAAPTSETAPNHYVASSSGGRGSASRTPLGAMSDLLRFVIENAEYCILANVKQHHMLAVRDAAQKEHEEQLQLELQLAQQGYYQQQDL